MGRGFAFSTTLQDYFRCRPRVLHPVAIHANPQTVCAEMLSTEGAKTGKAGPYCKPAAQVDSRCEVKQLEGSVR